MLEHGKQEVDGTGIKAIEALRAHVQNTVLKSLDPMLKSVARVKRKEVVP